MSSSSLNHRRYNPLLDEWVIVAANRVQRPWQGAQEKGKVEETKKKPTEGGGNVEAFATPTDEINALAPGGERAFGRKTEHYETTHVFNNDFPSFTDFDGTTTTESDEKENPSKEGDEDDLFRQQKVRGVCRVICYNPDTKKQVGLMSAKELRAIVDVWVTEQNRWSAKYDWVQIFENKGAAVGCSNMHPHGQLWASDFLPNVPGKKDRAQKQYWERHNGACLLVNYLRKELVDKTRIVFENDHWVCVVPYWAFWPYETMLLPKRHVSRIDQLDENEKDGLADAYKRLITRYDNLFQCIFPFCMGILGAPTGRYLGAAEDPAAWWQLHVVFYPPLLRSATVRKFVAGYELVAEPQRDITPEQAAAVLRDLPERHYLEEN